MNRGQELVKRVVDILGAGVLSAILAHVMIVVALLVRLSSPGPIFFRQQRLGRRGAPFVMLKFRTMYLDQDHRLRSAGIQRTGPSKLLKFENDPRVTPVGR